MSAAWGQRGIRDALVIVRDSEGRAYVLELTRPMSATFDVDYDHCTYNYIDFAGVSFATEPLGRALFSVHLERGYGRMTQIDDFEAWMRERAERPFGEQPGLPPATPALEP